MKDLDKMSDQELVSRIRHIADHVNDLCDEALGRGIQILLNFEDDQSITQVDMGDVFSIYVDAHKGITL